MGIISTAISRTLAYGTEFQRGYMWLVRHSDLKISGGNLGTASGTCGPDDVARTRRRILTETLSLKDAFGELHIRVADGTRKTLKGVEGTLIHEGRHAYDQAKVISLLSRGLDVTGDDPTRWELEFMANFEYASYVDRCIKKRHPEAWAFYSEAVNGIRVATPRNKLKWLKGVSPSIKGITKRLQSNYAYTAKNKKGSVTVSQHYGLSRSRRYDHRPARVGFGGRRQ